MEKIKKVVADLYIDNDFQLYELPPILNYPSGPFQPPPVKIKYKNKKNRLTFNARGVKYDVANVIATHCLPNPKKRKTVGFYDEDPLNVHPDNLFWREPSHQKRVYCYYVPSLPAPPLTADKANEFHIVAIYDSAMDASRALGIGPTSIYRCLQGAARQTAGYYWSYDSKESSGKVLSRFEDTLSKKVTQYAVPGVSPVTKAGGSQITAPIRLTTYDSVRHAAIENGIPPTSVSNCARGLQKTAGNYFWSYKDNYPLDKIIEATRPKPTRTGAPVYKYYLPGRDPDFDPNHPTLPNYPKLIKPYSSIRDAAENEGTTPLSLTSHLQGNSYLLDGHYWSRTPLTNSEMKKLNTSQKHGNSRPVYQYTYPQLTFMETYDSIKQASQHSGVSYAAIQRCLGGITKSTQHPETLERTKWSYEPIKGSS